MVWRRNVPGRLRGAPITYRGIAVDARAASTEPVLSPFSLARPAVRIDSAIRHDVHWPLHTWPVCVADHKSLCNVRWRPGRNIIHGAGGRGNPLCLLCDPTVLTIVEVSRAIDRAVELGVEVRVPGTDLPDAVPTQSQDLLKPLLAEVRLKAAGTSLRGPPWRSQIHTPRNHRFFAVKVSDGQVRVGAGQLDGLRDKVGATTQHDVHALARCASR